MNTFHAMTMLRAMFRGYELLLSGLRRINPKVQLSLTIYDRNFA
jgi:hypothetical protein